MSTQLDDFNSLAQSGQELSLESLFPATVTIAGQSYACSRSAWKSVPKILETGAMVDSWQCRVRVRKALLSADGVTLRAAATTVILDSEKATVAEIAFEPTDPAFTLTLEAIAPPTVPS